MYEKIDKNLYTPMMRQYLTVKEDFPDTLVFYRVGDFYEMFFNDAIVASHELELVLTKKDAGVNNEPVPMAGVPYHAVETYIQKLSEKGYRIAIVDQMEEANNKKIVNREVTRIITPGTNIDEHFLNEKNNNYLGSIDLTKRGLTFAYVDLSTGEARLTVLPKYWDRLYNEISKLQIKEIVVTQSVPKTVREYLQHVMHLMLSHPASNSLDDYMNGLIDNLHEDEKTAAKELLKYLVDTQKRTLIHIKPFITYNIDEFLKLDYNSIHNLELITSIRSNDPRNSLFGILDHCATAMGSRYLKRSILYPLTNMFSLNILIKNYILYYLFFYHIAYTCP